MGSARNAFHPVVDLIQSWLIEPALPVHACRLSSPRTRKGGFPLSDHFATLHALDVLLHKLRRAQSLCLLLHCRPLFVRHRSGVLPLVLCPRAVLHLTLDAFSDPLFYPARAKRPNGQTANWPSGQAAKPHNLAPSTSARTPLSRRFGLCPTLPPLPPAPLPTILDPFLFLDSPQRPL